MVIININFDNVHLLQDPNVTLSLENFFTIKGVIDSAGVVDLSVIPSETLKQIVKEDDKISK